MKYVILTKVCEKCGQEFDWVYGVCPKCYPNGYIDAIREITSKLTQPKELHTMSTSPVTTEQPTTNAVHTSANYTSENYTLLVGYTKEELAKPADERKLKAYPEDAFTEEEKDSTNKDLKFQVEFPQTFVQYTPENLEGVGELIPDDEEVLNLIKAQLKVKLVNRARSQATSKDFKPVDGVI